MVWFSIKEEHYRKIYYDGETKREFKETDAGSITYDYGKKMNELAKKIEDTLGKKFHIVFFDSKEYKDHAVEGLNCKVDTESCVSVLKPMGADNEEDEVVYTKPLEHDFEKLKDDDAAHAFVLNFVTDVENNNAEAHKFTPSFDDDEGEPPFPPEDEGFGSDEEQEVDM